MIPVTKPFLPPKEIVQSYIDGIWERNWLTNHGPLVTELESTLRDTLGLPFASYLSNGTIALQIAIKAFDLKGEVITTPFSYVATTSSLVWEGCSPVFADIDPETFNIDPDKIEALITDKTTAILATHVFGNPCEVDKIAAIAEKYQLKVIYDAAHAFGTLYKGNSIFKYGDISTASFHATKLFHTIEGGAVFTNDPMTFKRVSYLRNFGHETPISFAQVGVNGKNSEFHAAMGLSNLPFVSEIIARRKLLSDYYSQLLVNTQLVKQQITAHTAYNYSYYPVLFETHDAMMAVIAGLEAEGVFPRRYFCPSLDTLNYVSAQYCPVSRSVSERILCLPLYHTLTLEEINFICSLIIKHLNK